MKIHLNGYTGCGLDDFDKKGEKRLAKLSFSSISMTKQGTFSKNKNLQRVLFNQSEAILALFTKVI